MSEHIREFPIEVVASLTTGKLLCDFGDMHECAEFVNGHPIWSHEFATQRMHALIRGLLAIQHPFLAELDAEAVHDEETANAFVAALKAAHGINLAIVKGDETRTVSPMESLRRLVPGMTVAVVTPPNSQAN